MIKLRDEVCLMLGDGFRRFVGELGVVCFCNSVNVELKGLGRRDVR